GSSSKIWQACATELSDGLQIYCVDLPGHGKSNAIEWDGCVDKGLELLADVLPMSCSLVGWSLGGLLAQLYVHRYPKRVQSLMLIASTPKFVASSDWPHAMPANIFTKFVKQYDVSPSAAIKQFNVLQTLHGTSSKQILQALRKSTSEMYDKHPEKIRWGLSWLQEVDTRNVCFPKDLPIHVFQGENDQVTSLRAVEDTVAIWKQLHLYKVPDAGHVPFISHQSLFIEQVKAMLADVSEN
ncbi:MAG: alpha/beta fold hydrolase, partial [Gammaproteobacteria bacterium]